MKRKIATIVAAATLITGLGTGTAIAVSSIRAEIRATTQPMPTLRCFEDSVTVIVVSEFRNDAQRPAPARLACAAIDDLYVP